jgi:hypothetical protein
MEKELHFASFFEHKEKIQFGKRKLQIFVGLGAEFSVVLTRLAQNLDVLSCFGFKVRFLVDFQRCSAKLAPRWRPRAAGCADLSETWGRDRCEKVQGRCSEVRL